MKKTLLLFLLSCIALLFLFYITKQPSNNRNWAEEVAILPEPQLESGKLTIKNMRDWRYNEQGPVSKQYITRTFALSELQQVWFVIEPFSGWDGIAHTYFVFDFAHQSPLVLSVESRREKGVGFSPFKGLFKAYDLIYLWGTEEDFTVGRAVSQKNELYMFPLKTSVEFNQKLLISSIEKTNDLLTHPQFYNTITDNCTSTLADRANDAKKGAVPFHYARVLPGFAGKLIYDLGYIDQSLPYEQVRERYRITPLVKELQHDPNFSAQLRSKLP